MKNKLNNKGYMLIEIILASALAFGLAYFILDLTIKLKNKNDDLLVTTQITTDTTIVSNKLMSYIKEEGTNFECNAIEFNNENKSLLYKGEQVTQINKYGELDGIITCEMEPKIAPTYVKINIPISVPQIPDKKFNIDVYYEFEKTEQNDTVYCSEIIGSYKCANLSSGSNYIFEYDGECKVPESNNDENCKIEFITSGNLVVNKEFTVDLFLVGGGGGGSKGGTAAWGTAGAAETYGGGGGGGGETSTYLEQTISKGTYRINIGEGGASNNNGGDTYFDSSDKYLAKGGKAGSGTTGGSGGSGGGGGGGSCCGNHDMNTNVCNSSFGSGGGNGGKYGINGNNGSACTHQWGASPGKGGEGQKQTTCEFNSGNTLGCIGDTPSYSAGGKGGTVGSRCEDSTNNTGDGGNGGANSSNGCKGGTGIVIIKKAIKKIIVNDKLIGTYNGNIEIIEDKPNWKIKFLSSGKLKLNQSINVDLFLVGGGGGGSTYSGGGGGFTSNYYNQTISAGTHLITIGEGGAKDTAGKPTSVGTTSQYTALGGNPGSDMNGGNGGSGGAGSTRSWDCLNPWFGSAGVTCGGTYGWIYYYGKGGTYGNKGQKNGGQGQGTTTCEFGEGTTTGCFTGVSAYAEGGSTDLNNTSNDTINTGRGGMKNADGDLGIIIIRNAR